MPQHLSEPFQAVEDLGIRARLSLSRFKSRCRLPIPNPANFRMATDRTQSAPRFRTSPDFAIVRCSLRSGDFRVHLRLGFALFRNSAMRALTSRATKDVGNSSSDRNRIVPLPDVSYPANSSARARPVAWLSG